MRKFISYTKKFVIAFVFVAYITPFLFSSISTFSYVINVMNTKKVTSSKVTTSKTTKEKAVEPVSDNKNR